jgi:hypothetical protein
LWTDSATKAYGVVYYLLPKGNAIFSRLAGNKCSEGVRVINYFLVPKPETWISYAMLQKQFTVTIAVTLNTGSACFTKAGMQNNKTIAISHW